MLIVALLLALAASTSDTTRHPVVVVVRHAEKASQTERDPALSDAGWARAWALDSVLRDARVSAIIVTPFRRNRETASLVAKRHLVTVTVVPVEGGVAAHAYAVALAVATHDGVVLVVGHSNTVMPIVRALGGPTLPDLCDGTYAELFTIYVTPGDGSRVMRSRYGTPDPAGAADCPAMKPQ